MITLYMIICKNPNHVYFGITNNISSRIRTHKSELGARFVVKHGMKDYKILKTFTNVKDAKKYEKKMTQLYRQVGFMAAGGLYTQSIGPKSPEVLAITTSK